MSGTFDLFNVTCNQCRRTTFSPFLYGKKNGDFDGKYEQGLVCRTDLVSSSGAGEGQRRVFGSLGLSLDVCAVI